MLYRIFGALVALGVIVFGFLYSWPHAEAPVAPTKQEPTPEPLPPLQDQVGRLFIIGHWAETPTASTTALIREYGVGGVIIMSAPDDHNEIKAWTNEWQAAAAYPLMIAIDQEGGEVQRLRGGDFVATAQPTITTPEEAYSVAYQRGRELAALGINTNFAPVAETSRNPDSFLYDRVFRDPAAIPELTTAMIAGYQDAGVTAVVKHYPGHPDTPADSHKELPVVPLTEITFVEHTQAFTKLIQTGVVPALMTAHVLVPSLDPIYPATLSPSILTKVLRQQTGYTGLVITDDMTMAAIAASHTPGEASIKALQAGADMVLLAAEPAQAPSTIAAVLAATSDGRLATTTIATHVRRTEQIFK